MIHVSVLFKGINGKLLRFWTLVQFSVIEYKNIAQPLLASFVPV